MSLAGSFNGLVKAAAFGAAAILFSAGQGLAQEPKFKVLAFCPMSGDQGHDSYIHEANKWFPKAAKQYGFQYDSTKNWSDCNAAKLAQYKVVMFLDNRPDQAAQRDAFKAYMDNGGGWIGCHFAAFALNNSAVPQNWDWYHNTFIGSGEYKSNTWAPTPAFLKVEAPDHPYMKGVTDLFKASANEWYRWNNDLKTKPDIKILASIDPSSFPLGTGPKPEEIWHSGYYPVVWTNVKYKMLYLNMGHNDIDYAAGNKDKSQTFANDIQNQLMLNALFNIAGVEPVSISAGPKTLAAAPNAGFRLEGTQMLIAKPGTLNAKAPIFDVHGRRIAPKTFGAGKPE
jgi:hypothetical protein